MPAVLKNDDAETMILDLRVAANAARQNLAEAIGAFLVFPTSVVTPGRESGRLVFPLRCSIEPGTIVRGAGSAQVSGRVAGVAVTGTFSWSLTPDAAPAGASYRFRRSGRDAPTPAWATQLPRSQHLEGAAPAALARQRIRLQRRGDDAERCLLELSEAVLRRSCRGSVALALDYRPAIDADDLVQRGLQTASRLLRVYASADRPPCSWMGMLRLDCRRDVHRELFRLDWLPADAVAAMALAEACGVGRGADPIATAEAVVEAAQRLDRCFPSVDPGQLDATMRAAAALQFDACSAIYPGPEDRHEPDGAVLATVARLVTKDPVVIESAAAGDARALQRVADQVLRRLAGDRTPTVAARRRCWEQFQRSGQLFSTAAAVRCFGSGCDPAGLAALDRCLARAAQQPRSTDPR